MPKGLIVPKPKPKPELCYACNGTGRYDGHGSPRCQACNGTGRRK